MLLSDRFFATWRAARGYRTFILGAALAALTMTTGLIGWSLTGERGFQHRLYLTLLAFGGDPIYAIGLRPGDDPPSGWLEWTRFLGLATTLTAVFAVLSTVLAGSIARFRARWRSDHAVLIGPSVFGLERLRRLAPDKHVTILGTTDFMPQPQSGQLHVPIDLNDSSSVLRLMGKPTIILFGARETVRNIARARAILPELQRQSNIFLRVEDIALVRDLAQLAPELDHVQPLSSSEAVAEAVVFALSAPEMSALHGQSGVHAVLIGLGTTNLAIAEQLAATCYHPGDLGMDRLRLTILDRDASAARARLRGQSPGLEDVATVIYRQMDGLDCRRLSCLRMLRAIDRLQKVTVIIVATGDDARNAAIGMRFRQIQLERLILKAPILLRNHIRNGHSPGPFRDISGGLYDFGGDREAPGDPKLEKFEDDLAAQLHHRWYNQAIGEWNRTERVDQPKPWNDLTSAEKRSSRLAARAAPHLLRAAGLVPDPGGVEANMHVAAGAVRLLHDRMDWLKRLEHERWIAEKRLDGYVPTAPAGTRDDERRLHPALIPWEALAQSERDKDVANIDMLIAHCRDRSSLNNSAWRWRWRVGVMGPLSVTETAMDEIETAFADYLISWDQAKPAWPVPLQAAALEIVTPDAPGFDRVAAAAMARAWFRVTGRPCRLAALRAARPDLLIDMALDQLAEPENGEGLEVARTRWKSVFAQQSEAVEKAVGTAIVSVDVRPSNLSDADLRKRSENDDCPLFRMSTEHVASHIDKLSDLLVWGEGPTGGLQSRAVAKARMERRKPTLRINLIGL